MTGHLALTIVTLFIDFKKALDSVSHQKLVSKIESYGIRGVWGVLLEWLKAFLTGRTL